MKLTVAILLIVLGNVLADHHQSPSKGGQSNNGNGIGFQWPWSQPKNNEPNNPSNVPQQQGGDENQEGNNGFSNGNSGQEQPKQNGGGLWPWQKGNGNQNENGRKPWGGKQNGNNDKKPLFPFSNPFAQKNPNKGGDKSNNGFKNPFKNPFGQRQKPNGKGGGRNKQNSSESGSSENGGRRNGGSFGQRQGGQRGRGKN